MSELKLDWEKVCLNKLALEKEDETIPSALRYDPVKHTLRKSNAFTPEAASLLLQLHPIYAIRKGGNLYVVAGKRTFHLAAFCLEPEYMIMVGILGRQTTSEQLLLLRYLDQAVSPLVFRLESSAADIYRSIDIPEFRQKAWLPPLSSTMSSFAAALGVSPAALTPTKNGTKKANKISTNNNSGAEP